MKNSIKVVVADDDAFVRAGVKLYLQPVVEKIEIIGYAVDGIQTIEAVESLQPDILLLDLQMPKVTDLCKVIKQLQYLQPNLKIIILSAHEDVEYVSKALTAGVRGYLTKSSLEQELWWAIQMVASGYSAVKYELLSQTLSTNNLSNPVTPQVKRPIKRQKQPFPPLILVNKLFANLSKKIQSHILNDENKQKLINIGQKANKIFVNISEFKFTLRPVHIVIFFCCSLSLTVLIGALIMALK